MEWRTPELLKFEVADLLCKVKAKADSNLEYVDTKVKI